MERKDVRVLEVRGRLDLAEEPLGSHHGGWLRLQDLQRDLALVLQVVRQVDGRHSTFAQFGLDAVAAL